MESNERSCILEYDDLMRYLWTLLEQETNKDKYFTVVLRSCEEFFKRGSELEKECKRLQTELNNSLVQIASLENKLHHARNLFDTEKRRRVQAEREIEILDRNMGLARDLLFNDHRNHLADETREKLQFLHNSISKSRRSYDAARPKRLNTINELESTGSLLSDLSYSRSEDDLDIPSGGWNEHRHSAVTSEELQKKRRSSVGKTIDINPNDKVIATTTLTVGKDGNQVHATSVIEAVPEDAENINTSSPAFHSKEQKLSSPPPSENLDMISRRKYTNPLRTPTSVKKLPSNESTECRKHTFITRNILCRETCGPCGKKIRFGNYSVRCKDCRAVAHQKCQNLVPLPCIPVGNTPTLKGTMGSIADYTPKTSPMIPSLIVHCINEIEFRGLKEIGLYRIPGSEKDVKTLKENFLRGKGAPNLQNVEIPVICGTIKDFLRSLREPLLTQLQRCEFIRAVEENSDTKDIDKEFRQIISELPQPNRDTLAFLILHLQKVAENKECKMPITNIAKVFGPTVVGYSDSDGDFMNILSETRQQVAVVEHLLNIPSDYWIQFINVNGIRRRAPPNQLNMCPELKQTTSTDSLLKTPKYFQTPTGINSGTLGRSQTKRKYFENTPQRKKLAK